MDVLKCRSIHSLCNCHGICAPTKRVQQMQWMATQFGGPMKAGFDPLALSADLDHIGLCLEENLDPATIEARYFQGRSDRYHAIEHFHSVRAVLV